MSIYIYGRFAERKMARKLKPSIEPLVTDAATRYVNTTTKVARLHQNELATPDGRSNNLRWFKKASASSASPWRPTTCEIVREMLTTTLGKPTNDW